MRVYGHSAVLGSLRADLPPVSLFVGPRSVGKWTAAEHLAGHHDISHVLRIRTLTADTARSLARSALVEPVAGKSLSIVRLKAYTEQRVPQNILLKALEEPAPDHFFILVTDDTVVDTIASRATRYEFGLLSTTVVEDVLRSRGLPEHEVKEFARQSGGRIGDALRVAALVEHKALVVAAMKAIHLRDAAALSRCAPLWTDGHTTAAVAWCYEAITKRPSTYLYTAAELGDMPPSTVMRILIALREEHRPRLVVRGSLQSVLDALQ